MVLVTNAVPRFVKKNQIKIPVDNNELASIPKSTPFKTAKRYDKSKREEQQHTGGTVKHKNAEKGGPVRRDI